MGGDPVSWLLVEPGWDVVARDGEKLGTVAEVSGDDATDIFDGLAVSHGLFGKPRYVPAERVSGITEGRVELDLDRDVFDSLPVWDGSPPGRDALPPGLVDG